MIRGHRPAEQQGELGGHRQGEVQARTARFGCRSGAGDRRRSEQQPAGAEREGHESRCCTTAERSSPSTSSSHGAAHRPCSDQEVPTPIADSGAMRQKRGSGRSSKRPIVP